MAFQQQQQQQQGQGQQGQQQGSMGNGGAPGEHHALQQGTEYTLQGVMRFLQIEWHNHERARNAWEIERAEMRAKIAKQEGEGKQARRVNEQLDRQIRMLESALRKERLKVKEKAGEVEEKKTEEGVRDAERSMGDDRLDETRAKNGVHAPPMISRNSFLDTGEAPDTSEKERELYLDNTTKYLKNCMKEIQYLLTPPQHPPPPQMLPNGNYSGLPEPPLSVEDIYARHQQRSQRQGGQALPQPSGMSNHQPPSLPNSLPTASGPQSAVSHYSDYQDGAQRTLDQRQQNAQHTPSSYEDQVESITHTYDSRGRAVADQDVPSIRGPTQQDADGWQFDDEAPMQQENQPPDGPPPRRPDTDLFPNAANNTHLAAKSPPRMGGQSHRRKSSGAQSMSRRRSSQGKTESHDGSDLGAHADPSQFKVKFALRGHLDVVRSAIFSGGGSPGEPEVCTAGDDGTIKRWIIPASYQSFNTANNNNPDLDIPAYFTHRGHEGIVTSLAACPASTGFSTGGRANGDGWIFSAGQDATIRVWERGRVDPKATLQGHTDAVWSVCVLPAPAGAVFGIQQSLHYGGADRLVLVSGAADGKVKVWAVSAPPQSSSPSSNGSRRGVGGSRRHSVTSGSNFPSSPQPSVASNTPFSYTLVHTIERADAATLGAGHIRPSPTSIAPLSPSGETFAVSYTDSSVIIFDTRTGEELIGMASNETYDGSMNTSINTVVATGMGLEGAGTSALDAARGLETEEVGAGATGGSGGVEGVVISGHEDRFVRFYDANSGQCTYTMLAHPSSISSLCLSKDGREAVSAGHDASIRFWSLEKRICTQDIVSHRAMRGEGVCCVCWSQDGRLVVSAGGDGVVKVFGR